jgi:hypothetical protein
MNYLIASFLLLSSCSVSFSQGVSPESVSLANVEKQGTVMAKLLLKKDYKAFAAFIYAPVVKMMGGQEKMASYMEKSLKGMEEEGFSITKVTVGNCSRIIRAEKQLQCTLTETIEMKHSEGKLIQKSTLIGISDDNGLTWTFIDTHGATLKELQKTVKELSNELVIPEQEEPTMISNRP